LLRASDRVSAVPDLEYTALKALMEAERRQRDRGVRWLVGFNAGVLRMVQKSPLGEALGREALHFTLRTSLRNFEQFDHSSKSSKIVQHTDKLSPRNR
jgi:hypothetical protein